MVKISVIMASYEHERFVKRCVQSVLDQTFQDFEFLITDDGSKDKTADVIRSIKDPRIKLHVFPENLGAAYAGNDALSRASGEYIALINSDDFWYPHKLEKQLLHLESNPRFAAVFTHPCVVDEDGQAIPAHPLQTVFDKHSNGRHWWLRYFFFEGNALCHPTVLMRKKAYEEIGFYDPRLCQLGDFDLWVRLACQYDFDILPEPLIGFRILNGNRNVSSPNLDNMVRDMWEFEQVLNHYLHMREEDFGIAFRQEIETFKLYGLPHKVSLGWLAVRGTRPAHHMFGLRLLHTAIGEGLPGIDTKQLRMLVTLLDPYRVNSGMTP